MEAFSQLSLSLPQMTLFVVVVVLFCQPWFDKKTNQHCVYEIQSKEPHQILLKYNSLLILCEFHIVCPNLIHFLVLPYLPSNTVASLPKEDKK